jgi:hypothetical protein
MSTDDMRSAFDIAVHLFGFANRGLKSLALKFLGCAAQIFEVADAGLLRKYITKEND